MIQPFKESIELGDSLNQVTKRFHYLEKRLDSKPNSKTGYPNFIQEILDRDHMEDVSAADVYCQPNKCFYVPHQGVFKKDTTTTKLRVVFDASAKTTNGVSINDAIMVGPVVQDDIFSIINQFRFHQIALCRDIEKCIVK